MRADRLIAALLILQSRTRVTAAELADELEVSVPTARRDLEALAAAGVPLYSQPGRGGGWALVGGARTDLSGLTAGESRALFAVLAPGSDADSEVRQAIRKLVRAVPAPFRDEAENALGSLATEPGWGASDRSAPDCRAAVQDAVLRQRRLRVTYRDDSSPRLLDPLGLVDKGGLRYLLATRANPAGASSRESAESPVRAYRVDRMRAAEVLSDRAERADDFDLEEEWAQVREFVERRRGAVSATVRVDPRRLDALREHFGGQCVDLPSEPQAPLVRITAHTEQALAEQLAGWVGEAEVLDPASVRAQLAQLGERLIDRYRP